MWLDGNKDIAIAVINSISDPDNHFNKEGKNGEKRDQFSLIIVDECHRLGAESFRELLYTRGDTPFFLGISATPDR